MPTLTRLVIIIGILAAIIYGTMFALATFVTPNRVERIVPVDIDSHTG